MGPALEFLKRSKRTVLLIVVVAAITVLATSLAAVWLSNITNLQIPSLGTIRTLGVEAYWDQNLTNKTEVISWATIRPGSSQNVTIYLRSISNVETTLLLNATNWSPTNLSGYMNLTWNYNGTTISPNGVVQVRLILSAPSSYSFIMYLVTNDVKQFSFTIFIRTNEYAQSVP